MKRILIIGGGIIGLSSAYYLSKAGFNITLIDQGDLKDGCSHGNAGMIVPSHIIPLAAPGMIGKGIRWMFDSTSPFYVKPRFSGSLVKWGYHFYRHSNQHHVERSIPALAKINSLSKSLYQQWSTDLPFDFGYHERGLLMLYQDASIEKEEIETAHIANRSGVIAQVLSQEEIQKMEPNVKVKVRGGVYYPGDAHITPHVLVEGMIQFLREHGVTFLTHTTVKGFQFENKKVKVLETDRGDFEADELVLAAGSWSGELAGKLGIELPMQAGKGYSFTADHVENNIQIPSIFLEARVAVTPMGNSLRFGGTMEITGLDHSINMRRVKGIVDSIAPYYPEMNMVNPKKENIWHGLRPCSPDGLPYIGRSTRIKNLIFATGHSMMGVSLGPGTGKLVSEIAMEKETSISIQAFDPERYN